MPSSAWVEALITSYVASTPYSSSTTPTSILPGAAKCTLQDGYFAYASKKLHVHAKGKISNIVTTPGTLTLAVRFGAVDAFTTGAIPLNVVAKTDVTWEFDATLTCWATGSGSAANMMGIGRFTSESVSGSASGIANSVMCPTSAAAVGAGFDSTAAQAVDLFATWSVNNAGNSITTLDYTLYSVN